MLAPLGTFINNLVVAAQGALAIPIVAAGLLVGGAYFAMNNSMAGKGWVIGALIGGGIMLLAVSLAGGLGAGVTGAVPKP